MAAKKKRRKSAKKSKARKSTKRAAPKRRNPGYDYYLVEARVSGGAWEPWSEHKSAGPAEQQAQKLAEKDPKAQYRAVHLWIPPGEGLPRKDVLWPSRRNPTGYDVRAGERYESKKSGRIVTVKSVLHGYVYFRFLDGLSADGYMLAGDFLRQYSHVRGNPKRSKRRNPIRGESSDGMEGWDGKPVKFVCPACGGPKVGGKIKHRKTPFTGKVCPLSGSSKRSKRRNPVVVDTKRGPRTLHPENCPTDLSSALLLARKKAKRQHKHMPVRVGNCDYRSAQYALRRGGGGGSFKAPKKGLRRPGKGGKGSMVAWFWLPAMGK